MPAMNRPELCEENDIVAWLILGYLCSHPDAKDTAEAVANWWLDGEGITVGVDVVRGSLQFLVRLGWMTVTKGYTGECIYGLNMRRRRAVKQFLGAQPLFH